MCMYIFSVLLYSPFLRKMRLEMVKSMQIEIRNGGEMWANKSKSTKSIFSASHGTNLNWDFDWIWIPLYLAVQIQIMIFVLSWICGWLKSPHHSGFWFAFRWPFRVSSSRERAVWVPWIWRPRLFCRYAGVLRWCTGLFCGYTGLFDGYTEVFCGPPKNGEIALWPNTRVVKMWILCFTKTKWVQ